MKSLAAAPLVLFLMSVAACARHLEQAGDRQAVPLETTLTGQVLLPSGLGNRGVEVEVLVTSVGNEPRRVWLLFDEQGRFTHTLGGSVTCVEVTVGAEVQHRIGIEALPEVDQEGHLDVGVLDLRDRLTRHRLMLRAADGNRKGDVRVGLWIGLPPVGPHGESVSLGSRQFPPVALGSEMEWLLPRKAHSIYFLVERPSGPGRGRRWRSGPQQLFGPFTSKGVPAELVVD